MPIQELALAGVGRQTSSNTHLRLIAVMVYLQAKKKRANEHRRVLPAGSILLAPGPGTL